MKFDFAGLIVLFGFCSVFIALLVIILLLIGFTTYVWYGNPSDRPIEATMGTDPVLPEPEARTIPSFSLPSPVGWPGRASFCRSPWPARSAPSPRSATPRCRP